MGAATHLSKYRDYEHSALPGRPQHLVASTIKDGGMTGLLGAMQRSVGNQAINHLLRQYTVQRAVDGAPAASPVHPGPGGQRTRRIRVQRAGGRSRNLATVSGLLLVGLRKMAAVPPASVTLLTAW